LLDAGPVEVIDQARGLADTGVPGVRGSKHLAHSGNALACFLLAFWAESPEISGLENHWCCTAALVRARDLRHRSLVSLLIATQKAETGSLRQLLDAGCRLFAGRCVCYGTRATVYPVLSPTFRPLDMPLFHGKAAEQLKCRTRTVFTFAATPE
jgi:hypothetical protein